jgi:hypothetical protein
VTVRTTGARDWFLAIAAGVIVMLAAVAFLFLCYRFFKDAFDREARERIEECRRGLTPNDERWPSCDGFA